MGHMAGTGHRAQDTQTRARGTGPSRGRTAHSTRKQETPHSTQRAATGQKIGKEGKGREGKGQGDGWAWLGFDRVKKLKK